MFHRLKGTQLVPACPCLSLPAQIDRGWQLQTRGRGVAPEVIQITPLQGDSKNFVKVKIIEYRVLIKAITNEGIILFFINANTCAIDMIG